MRSSEGFRGEPAEFQAAETSENMPTDSDRLDQIKTKNKQGEGLSREELKFLYQTDYAVDGYVEDDLNKLIKKRDKEADMPVVFGCEQNQIVRDEQGLREKLKNQEEVKAYVGPISPEVLKLLPDNVEYIYTEFPGGKIRQRIIELGTDLKTKGDFTKALKKNEVDVDHGAEIMLGRPEFYASKERTKEKLIILSLRALGFNKGASLKNVYGKARELGLKLCPPETGPQLSLQHRDQPRNENYSIGMEPILDNGDRPSIFVAHQSTYGLMLDSNSGSPSTFCSPSEQFAFVVER